MGEHNITWRGISLTVTFTPEKFGMIDHIEIMTAGRKPLPITETGYRSHFISVGAVQDYGGPVAFVTAWLDQEAKRVGWSGVQLSLF